MWDTCGTTAFDWFDASTVQSDLRLTSADIARMVTRLRRPAQEQVLRAKEDEVEELRRELALLRNPGVELPGKQRREFGGSSQRSKNRGRHVPLACWDVAKKSIHIPKSMM